MQFHITDKYISIVRLMILININN